MKQIWVISSSKLFYLLKTLDYLPDGHSFSTGNSGGHCSINFGRILKIAEWDFLKAAVNSDPEFVDLFRANGVGSFANLELYDLSNCRTTVT